MALLMKAVPWVCSSSAPLPCCCRHTAALPQLGQPATGAVPAFQPRRCKARQASLCGELARRGNRGGRAAWGMLVLNAVAR